MPPRAAPTYDPIDPTIPDPMTPVAAVAPAVTPPPRPAKSPPLLSHRSSAQEMLLVPFAFVTGPSPKME